MTSIGVCFCALDESSDLMKWTRLPVWLIATNIAAAILVIATFMAGLQQEREDLLAFALSGMVIYMVWNALTSVYYVRKNRDE